MNNIQEIFANYFITYCEDKGYETLTYVITSLDRPGNKLTNPHALPGNAMDFTLRYKGDYAAISHYNKLFLDMFENWPFRAGIDNTHGNIHIHADLGENRPEDQEIPYLFKEDGGKFLYQIVDGDQIA